MTFADGWVCRSCWSSNRQDDERCYRCKAPRGADDQTVQQHRAQRQAKQAREGGVSGVVTAIPSFVMRWYARITLFWAAVLLLFVLLSLDRPDNEVALLGGFVALMFAMGFTFRWAARAMLVSNPWAFLVTLLVSGAVVSLELTGLAALPEGMEVPWLVYVIPVIFGLSAALGAIGFVLCLLPARSAAE